MILSDVTTAFEDAAVVFGPQKGASPAEVEVLTARLHELAAALPKDPRGVPATGAAGGFSGGLWAASTPSCFPALTLSLTPWTLRRPSHRRMQWWLARAAWTPRPWMARSSR